jgi:hypothetical protein
VFRDEGLLKEEETSFDNYRQGTLLMKILRPKTGGY